MGSPRPGLVLRGSLRVPVRGLVDLMVAGHDAGLSPIMVTEVDAAAATSLTAAAAATRPGMRLGTSIVPLGSRSAAALAMEAMTTAALSGTEFLLGVGVSTPQIMGDWHGTEHDASLATTRERLVELRTLLDGGRRGAFGIRDAAGADVRVLLGTLGPRMRELAEEVADGTIMNFTPPDAVVRPPAGRRCLVMVWTLCTPEAEHVARRDLVSYTLSRPYAAHLTRLGHGAVIEQVEALRAAGRLKEAPGVLPDELVEQLFTTADGLAERLAAYRRAGAEPLVLPISASDHPDAVADDLRELIARIGEQDRAA